MAREIMTVRVELRTRKALDESLIDVHQWHLDHIRQGLREVNAGKFVPSAEVNRRITRLRKK